MFGLVRALQGQARRRVGDVRSLGGWLVVAVPFWLIVGRRAYRKEVERQRRLTLAPVLKGRKRPS